jgi:hypothetical protein
MNQARLQTFRAIDHSLDSSASHLLSVGMTDILSISISKASGHQVTISILFLNPSHTIRTTGRTAPLL